MVAQLFDRSLARKRLARAASGGDKGSLFLQETVAGDLADRLAIVERHFDRSLLIAPFPDLAVPPLLATGRIDSPILMAPILHLDGPRESNSPRLVGDEEALPFAAGSLDLIVSILSLHALNDLPGALIQARRALKPDGLLLAGMFGGETLQELRAAFVQAEAELLGGASPRVAPFADVRDLGALLQRAGFALPVVDRDLLTVRYASVRGLFEDLRAMGATNVLSQRSRRPMRRDLLQRLSELYSEAYRDDDGRVRASFEIISLSGWAPHESQQRPLRPGSGQVSLADFLAPPGKAQQGRDGS